MSHRAGAPRRRARPEPAAAPAVSPAPGAEASAAKGDEAHLRAARRAVARKMGFLAHLVPYATVCVFLLFVAGFRPAFVVALAWGIPLALHYYFAIAAPRLREELLRREVAPTPAPAPATPAARERGGAEAEHARHLERLSASIAHEIRNPVTAAKSLVQQMGEDPGATENLEYAKVALQELERVERSVSHLLRFARDEALERRPVEADAVLDSALEVLRDRIEGLGVRVARQRGGAEPFEGDAEKLRRALVNLLRNALDAFEEAETPDPVLRLETGRNLAGSAVWIAVRDNGPGMDEDRLARAFQPFYTSKPGGTGLGLALARKTVEAHGGELEADARPGEGTRFVLTFPRQQPSSAPGADEPAEPSR